VQAVGEVRLAAAGVARRQTEPPAHLDPPEAAVEEAEDAEEDAGEAQRAPDVLVVDVDGRQVEDEAGRQAQEQERGDVDVHVAEAEPAHVPTKDAAAAEHGEVGQRHVVPHIQQPARP